MGGQWEIRTQRKAKEDEKKGRVQQFSALFSLRIALRSESIGQSSEKKKTGTSEH